MVPVSFFFFFKVYKIQTQTFQKIMKKIPWHRQGCTRFCKFLERNTLYFGHSKNNKITQKDKIKFHVYFSSLFTKYKISICLFC
jgi:hypothetical protein